jgi:ABC-type Mn2+/Zn2+ transport system ATPase subunit
LSLTPKHQKIAELLRKVSNHSDAMSVLYIIGGCNGAGKTTSALRLLPQLAVTEYINLRLSTMKKKFGSG